MALTRIDSYLVDLDAIGGITFDDQAGIPTFKVDAVNHRVGIGTTNPEQKLQVQGSIRAQVTGGGTGILLHSNTGWSASSNLAQFWTGQIDGFAFYANDSGNGTNERLRITASGNVGIGTTNPTQKLHVEGNLRLGTDPYIQWISNYLRFQTTNASVPVIEIRESSSGNYEPRMDFYDGDGVTRNISIDANPSNSTYFNAGNVGIGTTNPLTKLDVRNGVITAGSASSPNGSEILRGFYSTGGEGTLTVIGTEYSSGGPVIGYGVKPSTTIAGSFLSSTSVSLGRTAYVMDGISHRWYYGSTQTVTENSAVTTSEVMRLTSTGNVGIGTTNPSYKLDVTGSIRAYSSTVGSPPYLYLNYDVAAASSPGHGRIAVSKSSQNSYSGKIHLQPQYYNGSAYDYLTDGLVVDATGNVGVGTSTPATKLHVRQSADFDGITLTHAARAGIWKIYHSGTASENIAFVQNNGTSDAVSYVAGRDTHTWYTGGTFKMLITSAGSVGVGTDNPVGKLSVSGPTDSRLLNVAEGSTARFLISGSTASVDAGNAVFYTGTAFDASNYMVLQNNTDSYGRVGLVIRGKTFNGANTPSANDGWSMGGRSGIKFDAYLVGDTGFDTKFAIQHLLANGTNNSIGDLGILAKGYSTALPAVMLTAAGNVGIGTTNPSSKLHVVGLTTLGDILNNVVTISNNGTYASGSGSGTRLNVTYGGSVVARISNTGTGVRDGWFSLFDEGTSTVNIAANASRGGHTYFNSGGNVGIGTSSPQDTLHVYGSNSNIVISNTSTGSAGLLIRYLNGTQHGTNLLYNPGSAITYLDNTYPVVAGTVYGDMYFRQNVGDTMTSRITIKGATGRIGIGTDTPSLKFHVYDSNTVARFESSSSYVDLQLSNSVSSVGFIQYNGGDLRFFANSGSTPSITIKGGSPGNVGIGTTNPSAPLHVQGNTYITGALTAESYGYARFFVYDAPASPDGTGYVWIRASMGGFNGGGDVVKFSLGRAIWENNSSPYGGPSLDVTGTYSREWHGGQEFFTATYGYHGSVPGSGWVLNAGPRDLAGNGYWFYLRLYAGVRYYFRYPMSSGYISPTWEQTTDPGAVPTLNYGVNILGNLGLITTSGDIRTRSGNLVIETSGKGIDFGATADGPGATSELLDDYEEGTFTPTITGWTGTYSIQYGVYTKIGRQVFIHCEVQTNGGTGSFTVNYPGVNNLPFARDNTIPSYRHLGNWGFIGAGAVIPANTVGAGQWDAGPGTTSLFPNNFTTTNGGISNYDSQSAASNFGYRTYITYFTIS